MQFYDLEASEDSRIQDLLDEFFRDRKPQKPDFFEVAPKAAAHQAKIS